MFFPEKSSRPWQFQIVSLIVVIEFINISIQNENEEVASVFVT